MPRIASVSGVSIYMYFLDHAPPPFHAIKGSEEVVIEIGGGVLHGTLPRSELHDVLAWANGHVEALTEAWACGQLGKPINQILCIPRRFAES